MLKIQTSSEIPNSIYNISSNVTYKDSLGCDYAKSNYVNVYVPTCRKDIPLESGKKIYQDLR